MLRAILLVTVASVAFPAATHAAPCPAQYATAFGHWIRDDIDQDGTVDNVVVTVPLPSNEFGIICGYYFDMDDNVMVPCECPEGHDTCRGNPYTHVHWRHDLPKFGITDSGAVVLVTWAKVQAFWDWEYRDGYTRQGSPSLTQNCYGHALGTGTYVDDGLYGADQIIQDCWTVTSESDAKVAYCHGHAIRVTSEYCNEGEAGMDLITSTSEKYRESPIYTKNGDCNSPATPLKNKFEGTDPPTPIGPYLYYKEDSP